ncbi:hypothetical protein [Mycolicibacterium baixiangningiae]|uniref:hypothetical protein n=1 Tax=Mycolicibacterium baixiangningiae TaxID=2761578 RepID=UPI0018D1AFE4|nr:hypothetical protein [Mycolicibacterium baixiangningiae]
MVSRRPGRSNAELARGLVDRPDTVASGRSLPAELTGWGRDLLARTDIGARAADRRLMTDLTEAQPREFKRILVARGSD